MNNVQKIAENGLCIGCGICAANCPKNCITFLRNGGMYLPKVGDACISCGKCVRVCPSADMKEAPQDLEEYMLGNYQQIIKAKLIDRKVLRAATSGGVVTGLISELVSDKLYDAAFNVVGYDYHRQVRTELFTGNEAVKLLQSCGSRYLPVSQEDAMRYILKNRQQRVIIVATSCAVTGIEKTIALNHLNRENYLLVGLFCDKTMNYSVVDYFDQHPQVGGLAVKEFYFRNKVECKWPGNVRMILENGQEVVLSSVSRKQVKDYFAPERCLYCLDKLNRCADISVGDNYIKGNEDDEGISSVIIRTMEGRIAWEHCAKAFEWKEDVPAVLMDSQLLHKKRDNQQYGILKGLYPGQSVPGRVQRQYHMLMQKQKLAQSDTDKLYYHISKDIQKRQLVFKIKHRLKKCWVMEVNNSNFPHKFWE